MGKALKLVGVLTVICVISALLLSYVYNDIAAPAIAAREKEEAVRAVKEIVPDADDYEIIQDESGKIKHYEVIVGGKVNQVAIPTEATGFGGPVKLLVVSDMDGNITGVSVAGQSETPGYGDKIVTETWFVEQFTDMNLVENEFVVGSDIDSLAGATVTSGAAGRAVQNAAEYFMVNFMEGMEEQLAEQERQEAYDNMKELLPDAENFEYISDESGETLYYTALQAGEVFAYGFITESKGLNGPVEILTVTDTEGLIIDNKVISQVDTPGYGDRIIDEPEFMEQFIDMSLAEDTFAIGDTIDGLSGATVTSTGATKAVANAASIWAEHFGTSASPKDDSSPTQGNNTEDQYDIESIMNEYLESITKYSSKEVEEGKFYAASNEGQIEAVGILTKAEGMVSDVVVLTISNLEGNIIDVVVVEQNDTPSIGEKVIEEEWFTDQYQGLNLSDNSFEVDSDIDVIASVTVTSEAVNNSVIKASSIWKEYLSDGKVEEQVSNISADESNDENQQEDSYDVKALIEEHVDSVSEYDVVEVDDGKYYIAINNESRLAAGILTKAEGMVSEVVVLTISDLEGNITDVVVVEQNDTPSIGEKVIEEEWFTDQYKELNLLNCNFEIDSDIDVIASVTVTSEAVNDSVVKASEIFEEYIMEGAGQ